MTKSNRNPNKIILPPFLRGVAALLSLTFVISWGIPALAVSPEIRIDETRTLLEDSDTKGEGYLVVEASTPVGFEGILCVELQKKVSSGKVTIQISPADYYIGGQYMEPGTYIVRKAYALNDETAIVEADRVLQVGESRELAVDVIVGAAVDIRVEFLAIVSVILLQRIYRAHIIAYPRHLAVVLAVEIVCGAAEGQDRKSVV